MLSVPDKYHEEPRGFDTPCWVWDGYVSPDGYAHIGRNLAHRRMYETVIGPIPGGLEIDHLCRVRACVNPAHLEPVTHAENMRRSAPATKTHCKHGHLFDAANTYDRPRDGRRMCRACNAQAVARYNAKKAAA